MNQGLIRLLKKKKKLTTLYAQGRLTPHLHVLTDTRVRAHLQAQLHTWALFQKPLCGQSAQPSHLRKYLPHLNSQTGSSFPDGALCVLTAGLPTLVPDCKHRLLSTRNRGSQSRAPRSGARRSAEPGGPHKPPSVCLSRFTATSSSAPEVCTMTGGVTWGPGSPSSCENSQRTRPNCLIRCPPPILARATPSTSITCVT